jgi:exodeoxyribonuclease-3
MALLVTVSAAAEPFRIMTYNVWLGFNKKKNLEPATEWIITQNVDVLALQELKGFNQERLEQAAVKWGHGHALIYDRVGGFPQGLTSKTPIEKIEQIMPENDPKLRGTLHCKTAGIHFFVVHFDPRSCLKRRKEAAAVADRVKPLVDAGEKVVVLGDFNAHSPADRQVLSGRAALMEKWRAREGGNIRAFDDNGELDYTVLQALFDAGVVDPSAHPMPTFPTRLLFTDLPEAEFAERQHRIDFILAGPAFAEGLILYPRDDVLDTVSDHYPVILEIGK